MKIGFIGVGIMGAPIARTLLRAGYSMWVYNRTASRIDAVLRAGTTGHAVSSLDELADCDVVFTCLALPQHVEEISLGKEGGKGLYDYLRPDSIHVELSTISPVTAEGLVAAASERGLRYVQCPLGKTPAHAEKGEAPLFIGGDATAIEQLKDVFANMGVPNYVGSVSAACAVKLISNLVGMTNLLVLAEGLRIGQAAGLDMTQLLSLLQDTGARSFQMDERGPRIIAGDYMPRFKLDLALKDVRLGHEMAVQWGLEPKTMRVALEAYIRGHEQGLGNEDCCALFKALK